MNWNPKIGHQARKAETRETQIFTKIKQEDRIKSWLENKFNLAKEITEIIQELQLSRYIRTVE